MPESDKPEEPKKEAELILTAEEAAVVYAALEGSLLARNEIAPKIRKWVERNVEA